MAVFCINPLLFEKKRTNFALKGCENGLHCPCNEKATTSHLLIRRKNNKGSEVIMPEYEHNREERIDAVIHEILSSKENAIRFMQEAGLYDAEGHLAPMYR